MVSPAHGLEVGRPQVWVLPLTSSSSSNRVAGWELVGYELGREPGGEIAHQLAWSGAKPCRVVESYRVSWGGLEGRVVGVKRE